MTNNVSSSSVSVVSVASTARFFKVSGKVIHKGKTFSPKTGAKIIAPKGRVDASVLASARSLLPPGLPEGIEKGLMFTLLLQVRAGRQGYLYPCPNLFGIDIAR